ncbi:hypothetical protein FACS1894169_14380 [Bacteroidia bacterium]|nr:hypothetical protein FACS1894169_14380 [Bacteroidia bacterium]
MEKEYITPTKNNPVFIVINTYEGYIVNDYCMYKDWQIKTDNCHTVGETTEITLHGAMGKLFEHIQDNTDKESAKYAIEMIDGTVDRFGDVVHKTVYKITMKEAKKFKII